MNDQLDTQEGVLQQDPPSKKLYDFMVGRKVYSKSYDEFKTQFSSPEKIEKLHSFLSNSQNEEGGKLYSKSINEFNDQFFQDIKKKETSPSNSFGFPSALQYPKVDAVTKEPVQEKPARITDIIGASKSVKELEGKGEWTGEDIEGGGGEFKHDQEALSYSKKIDEQITKETGVSSKEIYNLTQKLNFTPEKHDELNYKISTNPYGAIRDLSHINWKTSFEKKAAEEYEKAKANNDHIRERDIEAAVNNAHELPVVEDYNGMRKKIVAQSTAIRTVFEDPEEAQAYLSTEASVVYGTHILPHLGNDGKWYKSSYDNKPTTNDPLGKGLKDGNAGINRYQSIYLDYLKDLKPIGDRGYGLYKGILTPLKDRGESAFGGLGYEYRQKEAEEGGINLAYKAAIELRDEAYARGDEAGVNIIEAEINKIKSDSEGLDNKYLKIQRHEAELNAIDVLGNKSNDITRVWNKIAIATGDMVLGALTTGLASIIAPNDEVGVNNRLMWLYGYNKNMEEVTHDASSTEFRPQYDLDITPEIALEIDKIKKSDISDEEKLQKVAQLSMDNPKDFKKVTPLRATNWSVRSVWNGVSSLGAEIVPYIVAGTLTSGATSEMLVAKYAKSTAVAALPMLNDNIQIAQERGSSNPLGDGIRSSVITGLAMAGMGTIKEIRSFAEGVKNPAIKDLLGKLSDKEIAAGLSMASKSTTTQAFKTAIDVVKKAALSAPKVTATLSAADAVNSAIDDEDTQPMGVEDKIASFAAETFKMFTFEMLTGIGGAFIRKQKPNDLHKLSIHEIGKNPDMAIAEIDRQLEKNEISKEQHTELKKNIDVAKKVYENTPAINAKGDRLTDKESRELGYLKLRKAKLEEFMSKDIPTELQEKTTAELAKVQDEIEKVYKGTFIDNIILDENERDISKILQDSRDKKELGGGYSFFEKDEDLLREVAMQAQNVQQDGSVSKLQTDYQAYKTAVNQLGSNGEAIVDVAIKKFPKKSLVKEVPIPEPPTKVPAEVTKTGKGETISNDDPFLHEKTELEKLGKSAVETNNILEEKIPSSKIEDGNIVEDKPRRRRDVIRKIKETAKGLEELVNCLTK